MALILTSLFIALTCLALSDAIGLAESHPVPQQGNPGGRPPHLGNEIGSYSDPHGNQAIVTKPGTESPMGVRPHGEMESGNRSSFGTPLPPNNLTPAPVLPFHPNRALPPATPPHAYPPSNGGGRFGR